MTDHPGPQRRATDPGFDQTIAAPQPLPDDLVEQTVERAATKVAAATAPSVAPAMSRLEAFLAVGILLILNLGGFVVSLQVRSDIRDHKQDVKVLCQLVAGLLPEGENGTTLRLAECLR